MCSLYAWTDGTPPLTSWGRAWHVWRGTWQTGGLFALDPDGRDAALLRPDGAYLAWCAWESIAAHVAPLAQVAGDAAPAMVHVSEREN